MESTFWHERWQENRIGFHQSDINPMLKAHWQALNVPMDSTVFVPLCGKSLDMWWLVAQGYRVVGVELSEIAAQDFFAEQKLTPEVKKEADFVSYSANQVTILCGDFYSLTKQHLQGAEAVYDRAALIALPEDMRQTYAAHLKKLLPAGSQILLIGMEYDQNSMSGPPFSVEAKEVRALFESDCEVDLITETIGDARGTPCVERLYHVTYR